MISTNVQKWGGVVASMVSILALSAPARAITFGFTGDYAPSNWNLINSNANGSVDTSTAPNSITLTGGNNGSGSFGRTDYKITNNNPLPVNISFSWLYLALDLPGADRFDVNQNGSYTTITNSN
ncbi:MAG: hypothetical protein ACKPEQ_30215, partial [Dolichospermum sp.]